jgi:hypothetical protein
MILLRSARPILSSVPLCPSSRPPQCPWGPRPKKGDALMFWSIKPDGTHDPLCLHAGALVAGVAQGRTTTTVLVVVL